MIKDLLSPDPKLEWFSWMPSKTPFQLSQIDNSYTYSRATDGFYALLKTLGLKKGDQVILPAYCCAELIEPIRALNLEVVFYTLEQALSPNWQQLERYFKHEQAKVAVMIHFFGFKQDIKKMHQLCNKHHLFLIEDCVHLMEPIDQMKQLKKNHAKLYSPRKFFSIIDGGLLVTDKKIDIELQNNDSLIRLLQWLFWQIIICYGLYTLLSNQYKRIKKSVKKQCLTSQNKYTPKKMHPVSKWLLTKQDIDKMINQRKKNMSIVSQLKDNLLLKPLFIYPVDDIGPVFFPLITEKKNKEVIIKIFQEVGVCIYNWPKLDPMIKNNKRYRLENEWVECIFAMPISQSISEKKITQLIDQLNKRLTSVH